jgi:hypothetical protein
LTKANRIDLVDAYPLSALAPLSVQAVIDQDLFVYCLADSSRCGISSALVTDAPGHH